MSTDISAWLKAIRSTFTAHGDAGNARHMKRYMKDRFEFYGIKAPERKVLSRQLIAERGLPEGDLLKELCRACFDDPHREVQYFVNDMMQRATPKLPDPSFLDLYDELIARRSWWDSVDFLAPKLAGRLLLRFPERIAPLTGRWIESDNFWYQRAALIFQLDYKERTDAERLFAYVLRRSDSREFFVQKGAGWALRQYTRIAPEAVIRFVETNQLPALTVREGLKWLVNKGYKKT